MSALLAAFVLVAAAGDVRLPQPGLPSHPTPAFDKRGRLWLAFEQGDRVYVTSSTDFGRSFEPAVAVTPAPEPIDANGEARPKIAVREDGAVLVTWTRKLDQPYTGLIRFSRSTDGGKTFSSPETLNDDGLVTGHRFDALAVAPSGDVLVAWIDKRDLDRANAEGRPYDGAAVYAAISRDGGRTFEKNRKVKDHVCECCRLSLAFDGEGEVLLLFRDLLPGGIRDHSIARGLFDQEGASVHRVTFDEWRIDACPHHGPSFWIGGDRAVHLVWFTAGERSGLGAFYARSRDGGLTFDSPRPLGDPERGARHAFVTGVASVSGAAPRVVLAWLETEGARSVVRVQESLDGVASFGPAFTAARGAAGADRPLLVSHGESVYLSWFAKDAGYRLIPIEPERAPPRRRGSR